MSRRENTGLKVRMWVNPHLMVKRIVNSEIFKIVILDVHKRRKINSPGSGNKEFPEIKLKGQEGWGKILWS